MDKSVISRAVVVAGGRFAPGHLGELTRQVPFDMVDAVLEETRRVQRRVRDLPARVVARINHLGAVHTATTVSKNRSIGRLCGCDAKVSLTDRGSPKDRRSPAELV